MEPADESTSNGELKGKAFIHADVFERITDAFMAVDKNFCYTYVNKKAGEITGRDPSTLVGKNMWEEFPQSIGKAIYHALHVAMKQQNYIYLEDYYSENNRWVEHHIYPSAEGISIYYRDITDKKKMEMALRQSEEKYRLLFEQSHDAIFISDADGNILEVNSKACQMSGYEKDELLTKTLLDLTPEVRRQNAPELFNMLKQGKALYREGQLLRKNGSIIFVEVSSQMTNDKKIAVFSRDITKRKKAESELREAEEKFRKLVEQSLVGVYIIQDGKFAYVNPRFAREYGYTQDELIGAGIAIIASGEEQLKIARETIRARLEGEVENVHYESPSRKKDGSIIEVEIFGSKTQYNGRPAVIGTLINITDRKKTETELKEAEEKFRNLVERSLVGVYIIQDGKFVYVNPKLCEEYGYTQDELIGTEISLTAKDKEEMKKVNANIHARLEGKQDSVNYEMTVRRKGGSLIDVEVFGSRTIYKGQPAIIGTLINITERKKAESALREAEAKFRDLVEKSLVCVYIIQEEKFVYVNPRFCEEYGYSEEELIGMDVYNLIKADDAERNKVRENIRTRLAGKIDSMHYEMKGRRKDSTIIDVEVFGSRTQYKGRPAIIGTLINITERKEAEIKLRMSEQKYKLLFESNPVPMWMFSKADYSIIDVNEAACNLYGYTRNEFLQMSIKDMRPSEDIQLFVEKISEPPTSLHKGTWRHKKKDGGIIYVEITGNDIVYEGRLVRLALANDITFKLAAEEQLKKSYDEIRQLTKHLQNIREEERTVIAREIHDELGQQLTVLKMDIAWVIRKLTNKDEAVKEKLNDLMEVLNQTVRTVRRISSELRPSLLDDLGLIAAVEWHLKEFERRSGIKTQLIAPDNELPLSEAIKTNLFRIFQESLTNVARHSQARNVKVNLLQQHGNMVLRIKDDGTGFDKEKANQKRTLGILGMKERAATIGGKYEIASSEGKGTTVLVTVPCC